MKFEIASPKQQSTPNPSIHTGEENRSAASRGAMACSDELVITEEMIHTEKMRKVLVVVVEELEIKNKFSDSKQGIDVDKRSVEALVDALITMVEAEKFAVAIDKQSERSTIDKILDEYEVDEENLKQIVELQEKINRMWKDRADRARCSGIQFADLSDSHCVIAW